ncbi:N-acyl homoserine lactonase family protein [Ktedonobacter sp. SOSP1-85]|uniref:N-acyl homoserine lactonase family protein n=1 Tax=Ktedonobacter sp. SOSP1-85 TaxID=2778367 RepID=UPI001915B627|nr:N-acyl homoserine lactonase family protein [Ktedonobacter sp. SOSP1-85]GHO73831.1 N-acyl homoserine lactonase family protein [Ktedonobacter sp. SOSP1-85]
MRIHAIQTGTVAIKAKQVHGQGSDSMRLINTMLDRTWTEPLPIYAWVIEHPEGLIVVDTGETARTAEPGYFPWWHPYYRSVREWVRPEEEIGPRLRAMGISPDDVRWVLLTHFHTDHAGGLHHFPKSEILVSRAEYQAASGFQGQIKGYLPQHWPAWFAPTLIDFAPQRLGPFSNSYTLTKAGDVHLIATPGHTVGHYSVVVQEDEHALFFAGDTSYNEQLMLEQSVDGVTSNIAAYRETARQILTYMQSTPTIYLPSHDPDSLQRLATRRAALPVNAE